MTATPPVSEHVTPPGGQTAAAAIEAMGLRKTFGATIAVADLHLTVFEGEIFGLVGPDGAGKTTTFRLLLGLLRPDAGSASIAGFDARQRAAEVRDLVGYVAQAFTLYADLSVMENIQFVGDLRGLDPDRVAERARELLELTDLVAASDRLAGALSGGMKRKLALICALLHRPRFLMLDEPTTGIDPVSRREIWRLLYGLPADGVTLMVSTPFIDEAERCHRLGFMAGGKLLAVDTPEGLLGQMPETLVEIRTPARQDARRLLKQRPEVRRVETVGDTLLIALDPKASDVSDGTAVRRWLTDAGVSISHCAPIAPTLGDVFSALSEPTDRLMVQS
jgi:ABC-2 type transport system ATP-binding protein